MNLPKFGALLLVALAGLACTAGAQAQSVCNGRFATIIGTADADNIAGTAGDDVIYGGSGNDVIDGNEGNDTICGGDGNDTLSGGDGDDDLLGGDGDDVLSGNGGDDVHQAGAGNDICDGGTGIDSGDPACESLDNMDVAITPVTLRALDGTALAGELYAPTGDQAAGGTRKVAMVHSHGAQGSYASGVPRLAGLYATIRGFTVLALNRRDWGVDAGGGDTLFEDATRDLATGADFLEQLGFSKIFIGGHSQGTTNAGVYPAYVPDNRLVAVGLYGTVSDARISAQNVVFNGFYDQHVATATQMIAAGDGRTVVGWMTFFGVEVFRSARAWLSYYGPDTLAVVTREIQGSPVPVLLLRADGDAFTVNSWSRNVRDAAIAAGVDATYTVLPYPDTIFDLSNFGGNAHSFLGVERETIGTTLDWLAARVPETSEFTTSITYPQATGGNYPPYAHAGADQESGTNAATLDGRRSNDIDGEISGYLWVQVDGPAMTIDDPTSPTPVVSTSNLAVQTASFQLTVTDNAGATDSDTMQLSLDGGSQPDSEGDTDDGGSAFDLLLLMAMACAWIRKRQRSQAQEFLPHSKAPTSKGP